MILIIKDKAKTENTSKLNFKLFSRFFKDTGLILKVV